MYSRLSLICGVLGLACVVGCSGPPTPASIAPTSLPTAPSTAITAPAKPTAAAAPTAITAAKPVASTAVKPVAKPTAVITSGSAASCVVGSWMVTNTTITAAAGQESGGAGAVWDIAADGSLKQTLDGSQPIVGTGRGGVQLSGLSRAKIQIPQDPGATSGQWVANNIDNSQQTTAVIGPDGKTLTTITGNKVLDSNGNVVATVGPSNAENTGSTWNCSGNTLTVQISGATPNGSSQSVVTLTRKNP